VSNKWLLGIAALLFMGLARFLLFASIGGEGVFTNFDNNPESPKVLAYYDTLKNGTLLDVFATNATQGHIDKAEFQYGVFGRGYFTFAFFLVGLFVGRSGFFKRYKEEPKLMKKILVYSLIALVVSFGIMAWMQYFKYGPLEWLWRSLTFFKIFPFRK